MNRFGMVLTDPYVLWFGNGGHVWRTANMCSFKLVGVLQAFKLSDFFRDWKPAALFICTCRDASHPLTKHFVMWFGKLAEGGTPFSLPAVRWWGYAILATVNLYRTCFTKSLSESLHRTFKFLDKLCLSRVVTGNRKGKKPIRLGTGFFWICYFY